MDTLRRHPLAPALLAWAMFTALGLVPPFSRDALNDHMVLPWLWTQHGWFWRDANLAFTAYPPLADIPYVLFARQPWDVAASIWHACGAAIALLFLHRSLNNLHIPHAIQRVTLIAWVVTPVVAVLCGWCYVDLWLCAAAAAVADLLTRARWSERESILFGIACGLMALVKYNGVPLAGASLIALAWRWRMHPKVWRWGLTAAVMTLLVAAWWYAWNWLVLGHWMYPLGAGNGGGVHWLHYREWAYRESPGWALLAPLRQFFWGEAGNARLFDGMLNPLWLLGFWGAWRWRHSPRAVSLFIIVLLYASVALTTAVRARYWLPGMTMLLPLTALALPHLNQWRARGVVTASLAPVAASLALYVAALAPWDYWLHGRSAFLLHHVPDYPVQRWAARHLPANARIHLVWTGGRAYYLERDYRADFVLRGDAWLRKIAQTARPAQDYLMINRRLTGQTARTSQNWRKPFPCLDRVFAWGDFELWSICR